MPLRTELLQCSPSSAVSDHRATMPARKIFYLKGGIITAEICTDCPLLPRVAALEQDSARNKEAHKEDDYGFVDILNSRSCYPSGKRTAETLCASYLENKYYSTSRLSSLL